MIQTETIGLAYRTLANLDGYLRLHAAPNEHGLNRLTYSFASKYLLKIIQVIERLAIHLRQNIADEDSAPLRRPCRLDVHDQQARLSLHARTGLNRFGNPNGLH